MGDALATEPLTAIVGAGAVGSYYGARLARAGVPVRLVGRPAHVAAIRAHGLQLHEGGRVEAVSVAAADSLDGIGRADLVLVCVKSADTEAVARDLAPRLAPGALVLSLQNGVDNAEVLARHLRQPVVPVAVYVAVAMPAPGVVQHFGRGDLVIGPRDAAAAADAALAARLQDVAACFGRACVPVRVAADVMDELWLKLLVNCAYNAISALTRQPYGRMAAQAGVRELQRGVVAEVLAVAHADGRRLDAAAAWAAVDRIAEAMPQQLSSTAQDLMRGKPSEIDHLNGFIVRRGAALGVPVLLNQALHALVKLAEAAAPVAA